MSIKTLMTLCLAGVAVQGCAHNEIAKRLDDKLSQEPAVNSRSDLSAQLDQRIKSAPGLSSQQRADLQSIRDEARVELERLRGDSIKLRSILIKDVVSASYDSDEVDLVKNKLKDVEDKRISTLFHAIRKSNVSLGRWASARAREEVENEMQEIMFEMDRSR